MIHSKTTVAIPPGETIREQLEIRGMTQREFATRMAFSEKHVSQLINGHVELTKDMALRLEAVLGLPASFWNNLESIYREKLSRVIAENELEHEKQLVSLFPFAKMASLGWVKATQKIEDKVIILRRFFEVAKLNVIDSLRIPGIAFRKTGTNAQSDYSLAVWAQKARIEARRIDTSLINIEKLPQIIPSIRKMTTAETDSTIKGLTSLFSDCGIAFIMLEHIQSSYLHGATFYDGNRIVMGLTTRFKTADIFWFSLLHEICHIIKGHISESILKEEQEQEADNFAKNTLIPEKSYGEFVDQKNFTKDGIIAFAKQIDIAPDILLGRLQKDRHLNYNMFNDLKRYIQV